MSATTPKRNGTPPRMTREEAAEKLAEILTEEPQSKRALSKTLFGERRAGGLTVEVVNRGLEVLASQNRARAIPRKGWVIAESEHLAPEVEQVHIQWPFVPAMIRLDEMFVDADYQRPLTGFAAQIEKNFDPALFQSLSLSDRGPDWGPQRFALMDGQTRWYAGRNLGIVSAPSHVYTGLSVAEEADLFARFQSERKGVVSYYKFRAKVVGGDPEAVAIKSLVEQTGWGLGPGEGKIRAMSAITQCYRADDFLLERTLVIFHAAWSNHTPEATQIKGLHLFFRNWKKTSDKEVRDDKLIQRLAVAGPTGLERKVFAVREVSDKKLSPTQAVAAAVLALYGTGR